MRILSLALWFVACGVFAGWIVGRIVPDSLRTCVAAKDFQLNRSPSDPKDVTDARWTRLLPIYADFDLQLDVELSADADLDVLVRHVEPRIDGEQLLPFQGRFAVLRLTTAAEGPGWHSRDDALLGPRHRGVGIAAGYPATVWIKARGRELTANVAGKDQGSFVADDCYGMTALVVHGGTAVVHRLEIKSLGLPAAWRWSRWLWMVLGGTGAALVAALAARRRSLDAALAALGLAMPALAFWCARHVDLQLAFPHPLVLGSLLAAALVLPTLRLHRWLAVPALLLAAGFAFAGMRALHHDSPAMDALFGPAAGSQISEAHAQLIRQAPLFADGRMVGGGLHDVGRPGKRVMLLGGQLLYARGEPNEHLEHVLGRELRGRLRQDLLVPCLPTVDGHTRQQWQLFTTFFTGYRPSVLVFGVPRDEMAIDAASGLPRSSPPQVQATIAAARDWCAAHACKLVLFADCGLPADLAQVVREATAAGVPTVLAPEGSAPVDLGKQLAAAIAPLLAP